MPCHPFDYEINPLVFSTREFTRIFDEEKRLQRWLDFEAALAAAQAELGVIPTDAAREINRKARIDQLDINALKEGYKKSRNSLIPLINALKDTCSQMAGQYVHFGATTQDVIDTCQVLELRECLSLIYRDMRGIETICIDLARKKIDTPIMARTHGQQALPSTFGMKVAVWAMETRRHIERLKEIASRLNVGQFGGAAGTLASLGDMARPVAEATLKRLGLALSHIPWHNSRDRIAEAANLCAIYCSTLEKIANEIYQLQKTEIGELEEPTPPGHAPASSAMPHKSNPVLCQRVQAIAGHIRHLSQVVMEAMVHEHERDPRKLWSEWLAMPQVCIYTGAVSHYMITVLSGLRIKEERMLKNLGLQGDLAVSEALVMALADTMGRMDAMAKVRTIVRAAQDTGASLKHMILTDPEIGPLVSGKDLSFLDHPELYTGCAIDMVEDCLNEIQSLRAKDPEPLWKP